MCRFFIQDIFLVTVLVQWSHIQVKFEEFQRSTGTKHSSLSLINLTCEGTQRSSLTSRLFACDSRYRTHISPSFLGTFRISKNEDFNGPYLENKNEFLKNSFETVLTASKSCDRGQLVLAFQLTFNNLSWQCIITVWVWTLILWAELSSSIQHELWKKWMVVNCTLESGVQIINYIILKNRMQLTIINCSQATCWSN